MSLYDNPDYRRGRSGSPIAKARAWLRKYGTNVCWLCGQPIDMTLTQANGQGKDWTLDHAAALSHHPELALDPNNHREAHRGCNSSRGNKGTRAARNSRAW